MAESKKRVSVAKEEGDPKYRGIYRYPIEGGLYQLHINYKDPETGKQTWRTIGTEKPPQKKLKSKEEADAYITLENALFCLNAAKRQAKGIPLTGEEQQFLTRINEKSQQRVTLDTIAERYFKAIAARSNTPKVKARYTAHIKPALGGKEADRITRADLLAFYNAKRKEKTKVGRERATLENYRLKLGESNRGAKEGTEPATDAIKELKRKIKAKEALIAKLEKEPGETYSKAFCKSLLDIIGAAYARELAEEKPKITKNPMAGLYKAHREIGSLDNEKERTFTPDEVSAILEAAKENEIAYRFILLAATTGGAARGYLAA